MFKKKNRPNKTHLFYPDDGPAVWVYDRTVYKKVKLTEFNSENYLEIRFYGHDIGFINEVKKDIIDIPEINTLLGEIKNIKGIIEVKVIIRKKNIYIYYDISLIPIDLFQKIFQIIIKQINSREYISKQNR